MSSSETINCEDALRLLAEYLDGELHGAAHANVEHHLETCRSCYSRGEFERRLKAQLSQIGRDDVRPSFEEHIRQLIGQFTAPPAKPSSDV
ncbi:MAG: anti-sigma factor family protein [Gemmatimonadaceae bacterium]